MQPPPILVMSSIHFVLDLQRHVHGSKTNKTLHNATEHIWVLLINCNGRFYGSPCWSLWLLLSRPLPSLRPRWASCFNQPPEPWHPTNIGNKDHNQFASICSNYLHMFLRPQAWLLAIQLVGVFVKQHSKRALANSEHVILKMTNRIFWRCAKVIPSQSCWTVQSQSCVVSFFLCSAGKVQFTVVVFNMF